MKQVNSLFEEVLVDPPVTEGVKYAGSKLRLIPYILQLAARVDAKTVLDGFSGTTRVSQAFAKTGRSLICNDVAVWSEVFGTAYLLNTRDPKTYEPLIEHLNSVSPIDGWFTEHYGGLPNGGCAVQADGLKKPWQVHNTRKLDGIRQEIDNLELTKVERAVALTSLMIGLDRVDSTLGHYASYLREWSPRSYRDLNLCLPKIIVSQQGQHIVYRQDIRDLVSEIRVDLAYFDPPYGSNNEKMPPSRVRYQAYYHLWKTVCLFDNPDTFGKAKRRQDTADAIAASVFEEFRRSRRGRFIVIDAMEKLIQKTEAQWIILSYSSGGRATAEELYEVLHSNGKVLEVMDIQYRRNVMSKMKWTHEWIRESRQAHREYLFLLEK